MILPKFRISLRLKIQSLLNLVQVAFHCRSYLCACLKKQQQEEQQQLDNTNISNKMNNLNSTRLKITKITIAITGIATNTNIVHYRQISAGN